MPKSAMVKRIWKRIAALLAGGVLFGPAMGCGPAKPREARQVVPQLELEDVHFRVFRDAALRARGEAARVTFRRDSSELQAQEVAATLFGSGPVPVRITAPEGHGVVSDRTFWASGGVIATRDDDVARTQAARFEPDAGDGGLVRGDDPVTVTGKGYRLQGKGFTLDPSTGTIVVVGHPRLVTGIEEAR